MASTRSYACLIVAALAPLADADTRTEPPQPLTPIVELRLRAETVDEAGLSRDAEAVTLRGRLGFETRPVRNSSLLAELELLWPLADRYDSTVNGKTGFPVVADPESYEVNRIQLVNTAVPDTRITIGRQRIVLDDHRFVGNVGWRQNEQTFDAVRIVNESLPGFAIDVSYVDQVNRVLGPDSPRGRYRGDSYLANVTYALAIGKLSAFTYQVRLAEAPEDSTRTVGARFAGNHEVGAIDAAYRSLYAKQRDTGDNPLDFDAEMYSVDITGTYRNWSIGAGLEVLTGDGRKGFTTPLATLHVFQGWADKFLTTPVQGLEDRYVACGYAKQNLLGAHRLSVLAVYHAFEAERLPFELGSELDVQLRAEWTRLRATFKYADYRAAAFSSDTRKLWAEVEFAW